VPLAPGVLCGRISHGRTPTRTHATLRGRFESEEAAHEAALQLEEQTKRLVAILDREVALLHGDSSLVTLGGGAQGGSVALHAALHYPAPLNALICLRCALLERYTTEDLLERFRKHARTPIFVLAARNDEVCPLAHQQKALLALSQLGFRVVWHSEEGLDHTTDSLTEQRHIAYWVAQAAEVSGRAFDADAVQVLNKNLAPFHKKPQPREPWAIMPSGRKWVKVGARPLMGPAFGKELFNGQLAVALKHRTEFSSDDVHGFELQGLRDNYYIRSGSHYYRPSITRGARDRTLAARPNKSVAATTAVDRILHSPYVRPYSPIKRGVLPGSPRTNAKLEPLGLSPRGTYGSRAGLSSGRTGLSGSRTGFSARLNTGSSLLPELEEKKLYTRQSML